jgi:tellurite resistance protein TerC
VPDEHGQPPPSTAGRKPCTPTRHATRPRSPPLAAPTSFHPPSGARPARTHTRLHDERLAESCMFWFWSGFIALVLILLALDLGVFNKKPHAIGVKEALKASAMWVSLAMAFSVFVYFAYENKWLGIGTEVDSVDGVINNGRLAAIKYITGYVIEESLSVDNIFVIAVIIRYFGVPAQYQHRVLYWGILGALVMRGAMIGAGAAIIERYHWVIYVFGVFLIVTGFRMLKFDSEDIDPSQNRIIKLARRWFPVSNQYHGKNFFIVEHGRRILTPLALALIMIETTDLIFAVDSIPAIFAITTDPFLVFTSNVFAILGLRSLYFALAGLMDRFKYLKVSLGIILAMVGAKMLAGDWLKERLGPNFNFYMLGAVALILAAGVVASLIVTRKDPKEDLIGHTGEAMAILSGTHPERPRGDQPPAKGDNRPAKDADQAERTARRP